MTGGGEAQRMVLCGYGALDSFTGHRRVTASGEHAERAQARGRVLRTWRLRVSALRLAEDLPERSPGFCWHGRRLAEIAEPVA